MKNPNLLKYDLKVIEKKNKTTTNHLENDVLLILKKDSKHWDKL